MNDNYFSDVSKQHIFIIGSKGIPANYGGFETFVHKLTEYKKEEKIQYHVACIVPKSKYKSDGTEFEYNGAHCFNIMAKEIGPARAIFYDLYALKYCIKYIKKHKIKNSIVYVLACRIGPFINKYKRQIHKLGAKLYINPDGHEWKRAKWSAPVRKYWRISERLMVKSSDLLICDSKSIEKYIKDDYKKFNPQTTFIAYGADVEKSKLSDNSQKLNKFYKKWDIDTKNYYLVVGRFVPENNFSIMVTEFMRSKTGKDLVLIAGIDNNQFFDELLRKTGFDNDKRIKFVGTVYDQQLLKKIRENAYGYFHGHSVGGTNPSLIEALGSTDINMLYDVGFNREVGEDGAVYWSKEEGNLAGLINMADRLTPEEISQLSHRAKQRVKDEYSWDYIVEKYEKLFIDKG